MPIRAAHRGNKHHQMSFFFPSLHPVESGKQKQQIIANKLNPEMNEQFIAASFAHSGDGFVFQARNIQTGELAAVKIIKLEPGKSRRLSLITFYHQDKDEDENDLKMSLLPIQVWKEFNLQAFEQNTRS